MSCCGKKVKNIARGYTSLAVEKVTGKEVLKYARTGERIAICRGCEFQTWMTKLEYAKWLVDHGIDVVEKFEDLTQLPMLPKYPLDKKRRNIYCRLCKCFIPAKARVEDERCPKNKWKNNGV